MSAEHRHPYPSIMQRLKGLVPLFGKSGPVVELPPSHDLEPPADVMVVAKVEQPPVLTPFQQLERFLEQQSGISDPDRDSRRSVEMRKWVYASLSEGRCPASIKINQESKGPWTGEWDEVIEVSIYVTRDYEVKRQMEKMRYSVGVRKDSSCALLLSSQKPMLRFFDDFESGGLFWQLLNLSQPKYEGDRGGSPWTKDKSRRAGQSPRWTANDPEQLRKVTYFITTADILPQVR